MALRTGLSPRGYSIRKDDLGLRRLEELRDELTVAAFVPMDTSMKPPPFRLYLESAAKIYVPKAYGLRRFGIPESSKLPEGEDIEIEFVGSLRPEQVEPVNRFIEAARDPVRGGGVISLPCAAGKCLGKNTPVMMYSGHIKMVQDIKPGELIMGDDSTPRTVLSTCTGQEMLYKVIPAKGDPYVVNESHILSLKSSVDWSKSIRKGGIYDIPVTDYLKLPKSFHGRSGPLLGYRVPIEFKEKEVPFDPYIIGYWLGDGTSRSTQISTQESKVIVYLIKNLPQYNLYLRYDSQYDYKILSSTKGYNKFANVLRSYDMFKNKHIPDDYLYNSRENRLKLLAGLIDSDGYYNNRRMYEITQKSKRLSDQIVYLARSLGFSAYQNMVKKICTNGKKGPVEGTYYRVNICGRYLEHIPVIVTRKQAKPVKYVKDVLVTKIRLEPIGVGDYYGFEIDGNKRFVLGDFTVTHNTTISIYIACVLKKKTLVVVHKDFLLQQWRERISQFAPSARVGLLKAQKIDMDDKDIVMASLQSLSMKDYPEGLFSSFGFAIYDECFPYDQLVLTERGPLEIGRIFNLWSTGAIVPQVLSYSEKTGRFRLSRVSYGWKKPYEGELMSVMFSTSASPYEYGSEMRCTPDHRVLTPGGMVPAKELKEGDLVVSTMGTFKVYRTMHKRFGGYVYDLEVLGDHTFAVCSSRGAGAVVVSNCHHLSAEVFSQALKKVNTRYSLGLSATPKRKDGLTKVFLWHLGDVVYSITKRTDSVDVRLVEYFESDPAYSQEQYMFRGKLNTAKMINNICDYGPRVDFVVGLIRDVLEEEPGRRFLVLSDRRSHVDTMVEKLRALGIDAAQYYGGMKPEQLKAAEGKAVIASTWSFSSEGLDIRGLNTLVLASPKTDVIQASGRILRDKPEDRNCTPLIIDIVDKFSIFVNQAKKRTAYYKKCKYNVVDSDVFVDKSKVELPGKCLIINTEPCNDS